MKEIELIKCLIEEIEKEIAYKEKYEYEKKIAIKIADKESKKDGKRYWFGFFMPDGYEKVPTNAHTKRCAMLIRDLCLKLYK